MAHELISLPDKTAAFAPQYFGSVDYYALLSSYGKVFVDLGLKADKRFKTAHRCTIIDTRDEIMLTVPVKRPHGACTWLDTQVSSHGKWWHVHRTALESAYGRTPFFEFYIDRFSSIFDEDYENKEISVGDLDKRCDTIVREILGIDNVIVYDSPDNTIIDDDYRSSKLIPNIVSEYYQLRSDRLGFRPGMSILDLIFNVGPEAPLILKARLLN